MAQPLPSAPFQVPLPLAVKIAAAYMIFAGLSSLLILVVGPLVFPLPVQEQFEAQSWTYQISAHLKAVTLNIAYIAAGLGLYRRQPWASGVAYVALFLGTLEGGRSIAWNWTGGPPSQELYWWSLLISAAWNGLIAALIIRGMKAARRCTNLGA